MSICIDNVLLYVRQSNRILMIQIKIGDMKQNGKRKETKEA
jgi:hypothetical protein